MSECYFHRLYPSLRTGFPTEWIEAIKKAQSMDVEYYIPGHGYIDDAKTLKADLMESRKALETIVSEAKRLYKPGASPAEAFTHGNFAPYSGNSQRRNRAPHLNELGLKSKRICNDCRGSITRVVPNRPNCRASPSPGRMWRGAPDEGVFSSIGTLTRRFAAPSPKGRRPSCKQVSMVCLVREGIAMPPYDRNFNSTFAVNE